MIFPHRRPDAMAVLTGPVRGTVRFWQEPGGVLIEARVRDLPDSGTGFFAFHIHDSAAGGHYDPGGLPHPRHAGDLPPLLSWHGRAYLAVRTGRFRLKEVLGRPIVIHTGSDDFRTQPSGDPGPKLAQAAICPV